MDIPNKPMMSDIDINLLSSYLSPNDIMLEWGSGASTLFFSKFVSKYYSIEHDASWANTLHFHLPDNVVYNLVKPDLYLTEPWTKYDEIKSYVNYIDNLNVKLFNKVFIDGRGRGFCALKVLNYINEDSLVFIHDFWTRECRGYFEVFKYYDIIDYTTSKEGLIILKKK
jgi:hypothetical protein